MPTEYMRKYPRLPADPDVPTFPLLAMISPPASEGDEMEKQNSLLFQVSNLSPNGILVVTENQLSMGYHPGERIQMVLDPRGWFPISIRITALICRISDEIHPKNGNMVRSMGIKFLKVDDEHRDAFLDLLRDILEKIKAKIQS
jgi:c-di-GMP-binding flagellar brake protein YcgR